MYKLFYIFSFYGYYIKLLNLIIVITKYEIFPFVQPPAQEEGFNHTNTEVINTLDVY